MKDSGSLQPLPTITQSRHYYERAKLRIPAGTQTLAKGPGQHVFGVAPIYLQRGQGAHVWDVDGNEFIDLQMAIGPISLGYCHPVVDAAIRRQLADGITFSLMHPLEVEVAEILGRLVPGAEMVRYSKTGCDVTSAAVRLARAFTGRDKVLCCGYHGWHDWYIGVTSRNAGVPAAVANLSATFEYNDIGSVELAIDDDTACVILEPMVFEEPRDSFLEKLRALCTRRGALLVFDEMWTGFRLALGGAQERFDVRADLACFSKAIANGMPISVITGRRDVMSLCDRDVFFFTTFGGEALSLAAARATLEFMRANRVTEAIARTGRCLREGYNELAAQAGATFTRCIGSDARGLVVFDGPDALLLKSILQQEMIRMGVLWNGFHNVSFAHSESDIDVVFSAYRHALGVVVRAADSREPRTFLQGEPIEPMFRKVSHFNVKPPAPAAARDARKGNGAR